MGSLSPASAHVLEAEANFLLQDTAKALIEEYPEFVDFSAVAQYLQLTTNVNGGELTIGAPDVNDDVGMLTKSMLSKLPTKAWLILRLLQQYYQDSLCGSAHRDGIGNLSESELARHLEALGPLASMLLHRKAEILQLADEWQEPKTTFLGHYIYFLRRDCQQISLDMVASLQLQLMGLGTLNELREGMLNALMRSARRMPSHLSRQGSPTWHPSCVTTSLLPQDMNEKRLTTISTKQRDET